MKQKSILKLTSKILQSVLHAINLISIFIKKPTQTYTIIYNDSNLLHMQKVLYLIKFYIKLNVFLSKSNYKNDFTIIGIIYIFKIITIDRIHRRIKEKLIKNVLAKLDFKLNF